ncbi:Tubulin-specific chaperone D [Galdieria sulphuraria]|nr:Tubulin-specific chaperone D [Galdieria sulphuraria]
MQQTLDVLLRELSCIDFCNISWPIDDFEKRRKEETYDKLNNWCRICDKFQDSPHLLDKLLDSFGTLNAKEEEDFNLLCSPFIALYHISKVRGFKFVAKLFPSQVDDVLTVLQLWKLFKEMRTLEYFPWQVTYVLFLWLSKLSLLPFRIYDFDRSTEISDEPAFIDDAVAFAKQMLSVSSKNQYTAAYFLAKILTRQDMQGHLAIYLEEFLRLWEQCDRIDISEISQIGYLRTIAWIIEFGTTNNFFGKTERLLTTYFKIMNATTNIVIRHLCVKNIQRLALLFLPKKGASWLHKKRYIKIHDEGSKETTENANQETSRNDTIDEQTGTILATIMEALLHLLDDKHTVTRYSVAKGIGRICMRLPQNFSDQALQMLVSLLDTDIGRQYRYFWHGACLTLAECARRGIFGEEYLEIVVKFVSQALRYDFAKGSLHNGSQVRDAACYVCWAFARSYNSCIPLMFLKELVTSVVCVACTDRELNCRRAAAAALQELVGRTNLVSQGIGVITTADYFSLNDLSDSYLKVLPTIAFLDDEWYRLPLIEELIHRKTRHWDAAIRHLASTSLAVVLTKDSDFMSEIFQSTMKQLFVNIFSDEPDVCHGSLLSMHQLLHYIKDEEKLKSIMNPYRQHLIQLICDQVNSTSLDCIRIATCQLLGSFFERRLFCEPQFVRKVIDILESENNEVQDAAARAFGSICSYLCVERVNGKPVDDIEQCIVDIVLEMICSIRSERNSNRRGLLKALGYVPFCILNYEIAGSNESIRMALLVEFLKFGKLPNKIEIPGTLEEDSDQVVELKITCIESATHFSTHILRTADASDIYMSTELENVLQFLLGGIDDYTTGSRGDIGSWVRIASMKCFKELITSMNNQMKQRVESLLKYGIHRLLRNCFERIDKTRLIAAETLKTLHNNLEPCYVHKFELDTLHDILYEFEPSLFLDCDRLFQCGIMILKRNESFGLPVLYGFLAALGNSGLQNKQARKAIECYLRDGANDSSHIITLLLKNLLLILTNDSETHRNLIPIIRMLTLILETTELFNSEIESILNELNAGGSLGS